MLLGGLWHGAAWNFVLWGAYQGLLLCCHRLFLQGRDLLLLRVEENREATGLQGGAAGRAWVFPSWISSPLRMATFFTFCCYGWLLFRANSFEQVRQFTALLFGFSPSGASVISKPTTAAMLGIFVLAVLQVCDYRSGGMESFKHWWPGLQGLLYATLIFILIMGTSNAPVQFIYFQF
jgi:D-alanyl-lipoteichoic acid acyltransferase DltB (MBOAT superfamily)